VQTNEVDNTLAGRLTYRYGNGIVLKQVGGSNALAATGGFSYATTGAKVSDVVTQINTFLTAAGNVVNKSDLIIITVGNWDVKAAQGVGSATSDIDTATTNLVTAIGNLTAAGAQHVVVIPAMNMARTPWAKALTTSLTASQTAAKLEEIQKLSITTDTLRSLTSFNYTLLDKLNTAYRQDKKPVLLQDRALDFNSFAGYSLVDGVTRVLNVSGLAITADTGLYVPVCSSPSSYAGCALSGLTGGSSSTDYQSYVFADDINLTPLANRYLADRTYVYMQSIGWAP
jgi:hypothetical protein